MDNKKSKVTAIILLRIVEEELEKIIDTEFANENDGTDYAAIDKMLLLISSIDEVAELLRKDVDNSKQSLASITKRALNLLLQIQGSFELQLFND